VKAQQDLKYAPKVKTNSEKGGYRKRGRTIYGPPQESLNSPSAPTAVEMPV